MVKQKIPILIATLLLIFGTGFASNKLGIPEQVKELQAQMIDVLISLESHDFLLKEQQSIIEQQQLTVQSQQNKITALESDLTTLMVEVNALRELLTSPVPSQPTDPTPSPGNLSPLNYTVFVNGQQFPMDTTPHLYKDTVLFSIRGISEALGLSVSWDSTVKAVILTDSSTTLTIFVDGNNFILNGEEGTLDVGLIIFNGGTLAPVQLIVDNFGGTMTIDHMNQRIDINN